MNGMGGPSTDGVHLGNGKLPRGVAIAEPCAETLAVPVPGPIAGPDSDRPPIRPSPLARQRWMGSYVSSHVIRVFIVDDHPLLRAGVRLALQAVPQFRIVGEAAGPEGFRDALVFGLSVDVLLLNGQLPGNGTAEILREVGPGTGATPRVVVLSSRSGDGGLVAAALRAGARGYLGRSASPEELIQAIWIVAGGGTVLGSGVVLRPQGHDEGGDWRVTARVAFPQLTERECEILDLLARGHDNRRIARSLVLSEKTVRNHVSHVFAKLDVNRRVEAAVLAREAGLGR